MAKSSQSNTTTHTSSRTTRYWRRTATPRPWWPWGLLPVIGLGVLFLFGALVMAPDIQAEVRQTVGQELNRAGADVGSIDASGQIIAARVAAGAPADGLLEAVGESTKCSTWAGLLRCPSVVTVTREAGSAEPVTESAPEAAPAIAATMPEPAEAVPASAPAETGGEIGVVDAAMPATSNATGCNAAFEKALAGTSVRFRTGSAEIDASSEQLLAELAGLAGNCDGMLTIAGHTDDRGDAAMNKALSQARAESVRDALRTLGIDADRVSAVGFGEEQPVADNMTPEGRATNRRITISVDTTE